MKQSLARPADGLLSMSVPFVVTYGLANAAVGICPITMHTILMPIQLETIVAPKDRVIALSLIIILGALIMVLINPLVGGFIDRMRSSWRCRSWILVGAICVIPAFFLLYQAHTLFSLISGEIVLHVGIGAVFAALATLIPAIPLSHRTLIAGIAAMAPIVGGSFGQALVSQIPVFRTISLAYMLLLGISLVCLIAFILVLRETSPKDHLPQRAEKAVWKYPNFMLALGARFLVSLSFTTLVNYTIFYLADIVHYPRIAPGQTVQQGTQLFLMASVVSLVGASLITGVASDKLQRRKPFAIVASLIVASSLFFLGWTSSWVVALSIAVVLGIGMGSYIASDLALSSVVLPSEANTGRDMGLMNAMIYLPMIIAPLVATITLYQMGSYLAFFIALGAFSLVAAGLLARVQTR